jgi:hypothetical protein
VLWGENENEHKLSKYISTAPPQEINLAYIMCIIPSRKILSPG